MEISDLPKAIPQFVTEQESEVASQHSKSDLARKLRTLRAKLHVTWLP